MDLIQNSVLKILKACSSWLHRAGIAEFDKLELHLDFFTHVLHLPMLQLDVEI